MSLNWDITEIEERLGKKKYDELISSPWDADELHPVTHALIWSTMAVSLDAITEGTAKEFYERLALIQAFDGPLLGGGDCKVYLTEQDVRDHIGLKTNATPLRRSVWLNRQFGSRSSIKPAWARVQTETAREACARIAAQKD